MATTIEPEGDPTFLAYERARQYGENSLQQATQRSQAKDDSSTDFASRGLALDQQNAVDKNTADYRSTGFGQSGLRAQAEDRIRQDIALKVGDLLSQHALNTTDRQMSLVDQLALSQMQAQEEQLAARSRLTQANAKSGVGI